MPKITIKLDIEKDFWNWWEACNKTSHGVDWKKTKRFDLFFDQALEATKLIEIK